MSKAFLNHLSVSSSAEMRQFAEMRFLARPAFSWGWRRLVDKGSVSSKPSGRVRRLHSPSGACQYRTVREQPILAPDHQA